MKINSIAKLCILVLLNERKVYGYEIIKEVKQKTGMKLSASHIYPFLKELKKNRLVASKKSRGGHEKNIYHLTKKGEKFYKAFLQRFSLMLESGIKRSITECYHCKCEIYKNHYFEKIQGKKHAFCCAHCAHACKKQGMKKE